MDTAVSVAHILPRSVPRAGIDRRSSSRRSARCGSVRPLHPPCGPGTAGVKAVEARLPYRAPDQADIGRFGHLALSLDGLGEQVRPLHRQAPQPPRRLRRRDLADLVCLERLRPGAEQRAGVPLRQTAPQPDRADQYRRECLALGTCPRRAPRHLGDKIVVVNQLAVELVGIISPCLCLLEADQCLPMKYSRAFSDIVVAPAKAGVQGPYESRCGGPGFPLSRE